MELGFAMGEKLKMSTTKRRGTITYPHVVEALNAHFQSLESLLGQISCDVVEVTAQIVLREGGQVDRSIDKELHFCVVIMFFQLGKERAGRPRTRQAVHYWFLAYADACEQQSTAEPDRVAVDGKQVQLAGGETLERFSHTRVHSETTSSDPSLLVLCSPDRSTDELMHQIERIFD